MQTNSRIAMILALAIFTWACAGCALMQAQTPAGVGNLMADQYDLLESTYKSHYRFAQPEEKAWMREKIAPVLDEAREAVWLYGMIVTGMEEGDTMEQRLLALDLLRQVTLKLLEANE